MNVAKLKQWWDEEHVEIASSSRKRILAECGRGNRDAARGTFKPSFRVVASNRERRILVNSFRFWFTSF
jgi:hypothetical protein